MVDQLTAAEREEARLPPNGVALLRAGDQLLAEGAYTPEGMRSWMEEYLGFSQEGSEEYVNALCDRLDGDPS